MWHISRKMLPASGKISTFSTQWTPILEMREGWDALGFVGKSGVQGNISMGGGRQQENVYAFQNMES